MKRNRILALLTCLILTLGAVFSFSGCFLFEPKPEGPVEYTVTFDAGEHGTLEVNELTTEERVIETLPRPTVEKGYTFNGWYTEQTGGIGIEDGNYFTEDTTLYARYTKTEFIITLNVGEYGTLSNKTLTTAGGKVTLPKPTANTGYTFDGWYTEKTGGTKVTGNETYTKDTTLYAHYTKNEYTITFNVGEDGTLPAGTATTKKTVGGKLSALPTPTPKDGYTFIGWYTAKTGGTKVSTAYEFTANTTLYAHFQNLELYSADFLTTDGKEVKNNDGETIYLRGVNAGGLFVTEHWMTGFEGGKTAKDDYKSLTKKFIERFGKDKTKQLWAEYRANWWTDQDFRNCADMGMNVIRLPFTYMNVDFDAIESYDNAGKNYDFSDLDDFVSKAWECGMYTILDLHGAYGSQNGQDHSGESFGNASEVDFYSNEQMKTLTVKLWTALSEHYKDNPAVAGYDILNEPSEKGGWIDDNQGANGYIHWNMFDRLYQAIRSTGDEHIVIFESCWGEYNLPAPSRYNWENCMYSFHHYNNMGGDSTEAFMNNWQSKLSDIENRFNEWKYNIPVQMGEFTAYNSAEKWEKTLQLLNDRNWHYTSWTYKVWSNNSGWGIYNVNGSKVDAANDGYDAIINKFKGIRTESGKAYSNNGKTLKGIFKAKLTGTAEPSVTITKVGLIAEGGKAYAVFGGNCTVNNVEELKSYVIDGEISGRKKLTLEITSYDASTGDFEMKADLSPFNQNGAYWMHAGFEATPANLPASSAQVDPAHSTVTAGGKTYSFDENSGCRRIVVANA